WEHYTEVKNDKPHPSVHCNYCNKYYEQGLAYRLEEHLNRCPERPNNTKRQNSMTEEGQKSLKNLPDSISKDDQFAIERACETAGIGTSVDNQYSETYASGHYEAPLMHEDDVVINHPFGQGFYYYEASPMHEDDVVTNPSKSTGQGFYFYEASPMHEDDVVI